MGSERGSGGGGHVMEGPAGHGRIWDSVLGNEESKRVWSEEWHDLIHIFKPHTGRIVENTPSVCGSSLKPQETHQLFYTGPHAYNVSDFFQLYPEIYSKTK